MVKIQWNFFKNRQEGLQQQNKDDVCNKDSQQGQIIEEGCHPRVEGENNQIIIIEKNTRHVWKSGEIIKGFAEIIVEGKNNLLEMEMPLISQNSTIHIIGENHYCQINRTFKFLNNFIFIFGVDASLTIGKNTTIRDTTIGLDYKSKVHIGKECMIAETAIRGTDFHTIIDIEKGNIVNIPRDVLSIGDRVWIAENCRILKNACISEGSIVGASSVVCGKFTEPNCIIAGNPAKVIKTGFTWNRACIYEYIKNGPWIYD